MFFIFVFDKNIKKSQLITKNVDFLNVFLINIFPPALIIAGKGAKLIQTKSIQQALFTLK